MRRRIASSTRRSAPARARRERRGGACGGGRLPTLGGTNGFNDEFTILNTRVSLGRYEFLRTTLETQRPHLSRVMDVMAEVGTFVSFIVAELDMSLPPDNWREDFSNSVVVLRSNQASFSFSDSPKISHQNLHFRSRSETRIFDALVKRGVLVFPLPLAVLGQARRYKEPDFLVCSSGGKWGILEVNGDKWHPPETAAADHERRRMFTKLGVKFYEIFGAGRCYSEPDKVIAEFLQALDRS